MVKKLKTWFLDKIFSFFMRKGYFGDRTVDWMVEHDFVGDPINGDLKHRAMECLIKNFQSKGIIDFKDWDDDWYLAKGYRITFHIPVEKI